MVSKELTKAAGLENVFRTLNKANNTQLANETRREVREDETHYTL